MPEWSSVVGVEFFSEKMKRAVINTSALPFFRFFAACVVVFFHFGQKIEFYPQVPEIFKAGPQMVTFFFVLSGFVLFLGYQQRELNLRQYWIKRATRILPLYLLSLLMSAGFSALSGQLSFTDLLLNLLCLQSWFPHPLSLNFAGWFVSALMFFYVVFPPILLLLQKRRPDGRIMIAASLLLWGITQVVLIRLLNTDFYTGYPSWSHDLIYFFPFSHFCSFFMGICGAYFLQTRDVKARQEDWSSLWMTGAIFCSVVLLVQLQPQLRQLLGLKLPFGSSFYAPVMLVVLLHLTLSRNSFLERVSWSKFALWGEMSYALYILQAPMDALYKYVIPGHSLMAPEIDFMLFFIVLASTAFLLTVVEKRVVRRIRVGR